MIVRIFLTAFLTALLAANGLSAAAQGTASQATLDVEGMTCPGCEATVESVLSGVDGVLEARADRTSQTALVSFDPDRVHPESMVAAINSQTYYLASISTDAAVTPDATAQAAEPRPTGGSTRLPEASDGDTGVLPWVTTGVLTVGVVVWLLTRARCRTRTG